MKRICHTTKVCTGGLFALLAVLAAPVAAFASPIIDPGVGPATSPASGGQSPVLIVTSSGMAGWEIALIAVGAALLSVVVTAAVLGLRFRRSLGAVPA
jgi:hypothetical protein